MPVCRVTTQPMLALQHAGSLHPPLASSKEIKVLMTMPCLCCVSSGRTLNLSGPPMEEGNLFFPLKECGKLWEAPNLMSDPWQFPCQRKLRQQVVVCFVSRKEKKKTFSFVKTFDQPCGSSKARTVTYFLLSPLSSLLSTQLGPCSSS